MMPIVDLHGFHSVLGPRTSAIRSMLGEDVAPDEAVKDTSEYGIWSDSGPLDARPPEFWADKIHDYVGGDDE